jgi:PAS domain S-box-containing protein
MLSSPTTSDTELARQLLRAAPIVLYVYDVQKEKSVFQNRRLGELLGHAEDAAPESEWELLTHPDDAERFPQHRARLKTIAPGQTLNWEFRLRDAGGDWRWFLSRDTLLSSDPAGRPLLIVGSASDITEQKKAEQHKELLAEEMRHRARNLVAVVQAIGRMSRPKDQPDVNKFIDAFMGRLLTLLNTGGIVLSSAERRADLAEIATTALAPFETTGNRIRISGPGVSLLERTAGNLALALHELATNALKYGALSSEGGCVNVTWAFEGETKKFTLEWLETGGPPTSPPASEGFGGLVIRQAVARERNGRVNLDYAPEGLRCQFEMEISEGVREGLAGETPNDPSGGGNAAEVRSSPAI